MGLEDQIKDLEHKLALKNAYLNVKVTLPPKTPKAIKETITTRLKELCLQLADEQEVQLSNSTLKEDDIKVLKMLADKIHNNKPEAKSEKSRKEEPRTPKHPNTLQDIIASQPTSDIKRGKLMLLDGVEPGVRHKVEPMTEVQIIKQNTDGTAYVSTNKGVRFNVPMDDIEFQ